MRTLLAALLLSAVAVAAEAPAPELTREEKIAALDKAISAAETKMGELAIGDKADALAIATTGKSGYTQQQRAQRNKRTAELASQLADMKARRAALDTPAEKLAAAEAAVKAAEEALAKAQANLEAAKKKRDEVKAAKAD